MRRKIERFLGSDEKYIEIKGPMDNFKDNLFCELLWPTLRAHMRLSLNFILAGLAYMVPFSSIKIKLYKLMGMKIGKGVFCGLWVRIDPSFPELITIGDNALIGLGAKIAVHDMTHKTLRLGRVSIGRNVVIGGYAIIRCGIEIGDSSVVGLGAVVYRDIPPDTTVIGNPARIAKRKG
ncbi:MAG: acyltransferase [bacterium]